MVADVGIVFSGVGSAEIEPALELSSPAVSLIRNARQNQEVCAAASRPEAVVARDGALNSFRAFSASTPGRLEMSYNLASIDVHKRLLVVVVADLSAPAEVLHTRNFGTGSAELRGLLEWLRELGVTEVVMESTAQYWKPVWMELEPFMRLHLAQAQSNRAPKGRKTDYADAKRLLRRFVAGELMLSFVPAPEQREWRTVTRTRLQLVHERVQLHNQIEASLEQGRIKLSSVVSDLTGVSGMRILKALAGGETNPEKLADLGDRLRCGHDTLVDALTGSMTPLQCTLLKQQLDRIDLIDRQIQELNRLSATQFKAHQEVIRRLIEVPGLGIESAHGILAEVGNDAAAFPTSSQFASWIGVCPGSNESAAENHSGASAKGNRFLRRLLCQSAQAAVKTKGSYLQSLFNRLLIRLGYAKAIWAIAHRLAKIIWNILHQKANFIEHGEAINPKAKQRSISAHLRALRRLGYEFPTQNATPAPILG